MTRTIAFDAASHRADDIQRAAYRYCDRLVVDLRTGDDVITCTITPVTGVELTDELVDDFRIEVLDQVLRARIRAETAPVRNAVLATALSRLALGDHDGD